MAKKEKEALENESMSALDKFMSDVDKKFGKGAIMDLEKGIEGIEFISSGLISLDLALGGGFAKGRIIEIYGPESSGKTLICTHLMCEAQKLGGVVGLIDAECAYDIHFAQKVGLNTSKDKFKIAQVSSGEEGLSLCEAMIESGLFSVVVVDSVAALTPKAEIEGDMGDSKMGLHARLMSQALRKITSKVSKSNTIVVFINQLRDRIGIVFGNPETTTGGNALKFYASQRLDVRRISQNKEGEEVVSHRTRVKVVKNKVAPPFRKAEFNIVFNKGFDKFQEVIDLAVENEIIKKAGSWFSYGDTKLGQGIESVKSIIEDNPELFEIIQSKVKEVLNQPK